MPKMISFSFRLYVVLCLFAVYCNGQVKGSEMTAMHHPPVEYNVVWKSPSRDSLDSMPLSGRAGAGANVWVQDGSIWIYLGHSGAFDEQSRLLKLGCLRITPADMKLGDETFSQTLNLQTGSITIRNGDFVAELWFAGQVLYLQVDRKSPFAMDVAYGSWRDKKRDGLKLDVWGSQNMQLDHVLSDESGFLFFHSNAEFGPQIEAQAKKQGFAAGDVRDFVSRRIFGGAIVVDGGLSSLNSADVHWQYWDGKAWSGRTAAKSSHRIAVRIGAADQADPKSWKQEASAFLQEGRSAEARVAEQKRWDEFWSRSHIIINPTAGEKDPGFLIGRNYQLFRYMLACNRDAEFPLLFNGGIFTTDNEPGRMTGNNNDELKFNQPGPSTPDFRRWMGCRFMSQNQRWLGWPTLANGDVDLLWPSIEFYRDRAGLAAARARINGATGVVYPEPMDANGLNCVRPRPDGLCGAVHLTHHFSMMLEHAWMALQAHSALGISLEKDIDWIAGTVEFYDSYYRASAKKKTGSELDTDGKLLIYPANGLEYAVGATNPIEVVAGLKRITEALLNLPDLPGELRVKMTRIAPTIPDLPIGERDGKRSLLPAKSFEKGYNRWEPIEHYAAWPYRLVGVTEPQTLQLIRDTWDTIPEDRAKLCKQDYSWMANVVNMAAMGMPDAATERAIYKLANNTAPQARFPAFFGPGHDWLPDHNWGGSGCTGLQEMLVAPQVGDHGKIYLLPAWPKQWDVDFKLHLSGQTIIEASVRQGQVTRLNVGPGARAADVVVRHD